MIIRMLNPGEWDTRRFSLLRFVRRHGERRIAASAWLRLVRLQAGELASPGVAVAVAFTAGGQPAGVAFAAGYGEEACLAVVHPALRGRGICRSLIAKLGERWGRLSCRVAADQTASLAAGFAAGLVAVGLDSGPTGKPALRLEGRWPLGESGERGSAAASGFGAADLAAASFAAAGSIPDPGLAGAEAAGREQGDGAAIAALVRR